jgi:hypothetical protein
MHQSIVDPGGRMQGTICTISDRAIAVESLVGWWPS